MKLGDWIEIRACELAAGGPGSGRRPGEGVVPGTQPFHPSHIVKNDTPAYNHTTEQDTRLRRGSELQHTDSSDKGEVFRNRIGHTYHVDRSLLKNIAKKGK